MLDAAALLNTRLQGGRWTPTYPETRYLTSKAEFHYWTEQQAKTPLLHFGDSVVPVVEDYALDDHVRLAPTAGHTPHHVAVCFGGMAMMRS
jgi:glyoxylase-like metal-dependent hydrolase (beta-lactamase superfamily II)